MLCNLDFRALRDLFILLKGAKGGFFGKGRRGGIKLFFVKHKLLSWNVGGLNKRNKRLRVNNLLREWKANLVCLQETKLELLYMADMHSLWGCLHVDWCYMGLRRTSSGISLMWDRRVVKKLSVWGTLLTLVL